MIREPLAQDIADPRRPARLERVLIAAEPLGAKTIGIGPMLAAPATSSTSPATDPEDTALSHFTSGTTGDPRARYP
jgi:acyl-coenzyme A synthetase/AMP-(fatty) acid ligase